MEMEIPQQNVESQTSITFKVMGSGEKPTAMVKKCPTTYRELLDIFKECRNEHSAEMDKNEIIFCIDGKPFDDTSTSLPKNIYDNKKLFIVVVIRPPKNSKQTHEKWGAGVRSTVEGYVGNGTSNHAQISENGQISQVTRFEPVNRNGQKTGVSLTFSEGAQVLDKNGNPIKISVQTVNGPSSIRIGNKTYQNVTKDN